jgi:hypothetical protein
MKVFLFAKIILVQANPDILGLKSDRFIAA